MDLKFSKFQNLNGFEIFKISKSKWIWKFQNLNGFWTLNKFQIWTDLKFWTDFKILRGLQNFNELQILNEFWNLNKNRIVIWTNFKFQTKIEIWTIFKVQTNFVMWTKNSNLNILKKYCKSKTRKLNWKRKQKKNERKKVSTRLTLVGWPIRRAGVCGAVQALTWSGKLLGDARAFPSRHSARARSGMGRPISRFRTLFVSLGNDSVGLGSARATERSFRWRFPTWARPI
jgi:hypothetical protein